MKSQFKNIAGLLLLVLLGTSCGKEVSDLQKQSFVKYYGSYQYDYGRDVEVLSSGGYAVLASIVPDSISKMTLLLTDEYGNQIETSPYYYGGQQETKGNIMLMLDDGFLFGGSITDTLIDGTAHSDMFIVKTDVLGNVIWNKQYGGDGNDDIYDIENRIGGGFVVVGKQHNDGQDDLWILMLDESGDFISEFVGRNTDYDDEANAVVNTGAGYIIACSYVEEVEKGKELYLVSMDNNCNVLDTRVLGTGRDDYSKKIVPYQDSYLLMGQSISNSGLDQILLYTFSVDDMLISNTSLFKTILSAGVDLVGEDVIINTEGNIAIIGSRKFNENMDMALIFIDRDGDRLDDVEFGGLGNQYGQAIANTADGGLVFLGSSVLEGNSLITLLKTNAKGKF